MKKSFEEADINTIEGLSAKLLDMTTKLKEYEKERTKLIENISHDLRAPLTAIRSAVEYMQVINPKEMEEAELDQIIRLLDSRSKTLETLVNDLYFFTSLNNVKNNFSFEKVPLAAFLEEYVFSVEIDEKHSDREVCFELETDALENIFVNIDVHKMTRVLDNLMTNAYKYSEKLSKIILGMKTISEADMKMKEIEGIIDNESGLDYGESICFYVKDDGIGIPKDKLKVIFDRTEKLSDSRTPDGVTGSGLGLSIVKRIVEIHGGIVWCESIYGEGSTFFVCIPKV